MEGVWGPNARHNALQNGGPECAAQGTFDFKAKINLVMVLSSFHPDQFRCLTICSS